MGEGNVTQQIAVEGCYYLRSLRDTVHAPEPWFVTFLSQRIPDSICVQ